MPAEIIEQADIAAVRRQIRLALFLRGKRAMADVACRSLFVWRIVRTHFKHSVERLDVNGEFAVHWAGVEDLMLAKATYDAAVKIAWQRRPDHGQAADERKEP
jgi:hypothetical protein